MCGPVMSETHLAHLQCIEVSRQVRLCRLLLRLAIGKSSVKANSARHLRRRASAEVGTVKGQEDVGLPSTAPYKLNHFNG
jgi:hypothetical protein